MASLLFKKAAVGFYASRRRFLFGLFPGSLSGVLLTQEEIGGEASCKYYGVIISCATNRISEIV
ncbi:hypothetical protein [Desulfitobacterium chlororespirans]|uniref:hypothetical protein n=1 Tax=Desulfitobacterium chlororespirans TaxID=51616 RepID=UPI000932CF7D|nr:hypothetical protein [Desulfitobacterium chlororespirans]